MRSRPAALGLAVAVTLLGAATGSYGRPPPQRPLAGLWAGWTGTVPAVLADRVLPDWVLPGNTSGVRASADRQPVVETTLRTRDGYAIRVFLSSSYRPNRVREQAYVDFLDSLPHGRELGRLGGLYIETPAQVGEVCGVGAIACYLFAQQRIVVPGQPPFPGAPVAYVIAHEYGHHIAAHRLNPLGSGELLGPEHWSQYEHVCQGLQQGVFKPGAESPPGYFENPGEAWAEAYAQYRFPHAEPWRFDRRLAPDFRGSSAAIRADVLHPWMGTYHRITQRATLSAADSRIHSGVAGGLDGIVRLAIQAPRTLAYRVRLLAGGQTLFARRSTGARSFSPAVCLDGGPLRAVLTRLAGSGPTQLRLSVPVGS